MRASLQLGAVWAVSALAAVPLLSRVAQAWGPEGHQVVALIAERFLEDKTKERVAKLLAADNDTLSAKDFASRATWADAYRESNQTRYDATHEWHYVDINIDTPNFDKACFNHPPLAGAVASKGPAKTCVVDKIVQFRAELADPATSKEECILAFKFLLHFVGDLHQPLHAADRKDQGGNQRIVFYEKDTKKTKLHSYWDGIPRKLSEPPKSSAKLAKDFEKKKPEWIANTPPSKWAQESFAQAKNFAYALPKPKFFGKVKGYSLSPTYEKNALAVGREQLAKGGMRLAMVLNEGLGQDTSCVTPANFP